MQLLNDKEFIHSLVSHKLGRDVKGMQPVYLHCQELIPLLGIKTLNGQQRFDHCFFGTLTVDFKLLQVKTAQFGTSDFLFTSFNGLIQQSLQASLAEDTTGVNMDNECRQFHNMLFDDIRLIDQAAIAANNNLITGVVHNALSSYNNKNIPLLSFCGYQINSKH